MTIPKQPGRYNLDRLGWKAFEDLCIEFTRLILGQTVTPFRVGKDLGRDGFFSGAPQGEIRDLSPDAETVVIQCKHTSTPGASFTLSDVSEEKSKIAELASEGDCDVYIIYSNARLSSENEKVIRGEFEAIAGVQRCIVRGEGYLEGLIDGNSKLLRRVPRLYGVGDLSQILSHNIAEQTKLILEEMGAELRTFVPTPSYRQAVAAMEQSRFVVLVGPPASGKSAIAVNLCVVLSAEDPELELLRIETADQFATAWSAADSHKVFWVEDFFGETTLDHDRAREWEAVFQKIMTAHSNGNRFIFTCRDYILQDAHSVVRKSRLDVVEDRRVFVRVDELQEPIKQQILYNHAKFGDLPPAVRAKIKGHLASVASEDGFTPELARRLGTSRFHKGLAYTREDLARFVNEPVHFFEEVIHDLSEAERAVVAYLLLSGNSLLDPVEHVPDALAAAYSVDVPGIRQHLSAMRGSLTKLQVVGTKRVWQVHHPSMIDAMHSILSKIPTMLDLYVHAAPLEVLLRNISVDPNAVHRVFLPENLYGAFSDRLEVSTSVASFLSRTGGPFLAWLAANREDFLCEVCELVAGPFGEHLGLRFLLHFDVVCDARFQPGLERATAKMSIAVWEQGCFDVFVDPATGALVGDAVLGDIVSQAPDEAETTFAWLVEQVKYQAKELEQLSEFHQQLEVVRQTMLDIADGISDSAVMTQAKQAIQAGVEAADEQLSEYGYGWESHLEGQYEAWRESRAYADHEPTSRADIFSDVDQ